MAMNAEFDREVRFEIVEPIGVLTAHSTGWRKELNIVKWNGGQPKYDIRDWSPDHAHMSRGVTLHEKEMRLVFDLLRKRRNAGKGRQADTAGTFGATTAEDSTEDAAEEKAEEVPAMEVNEDGEIL